MPRRTPGAKGLPRSLQRLYEMLGQGPVIDYFRLSETQTSGLGTGGRVRFDTAEHGDFEVTDGRIALPAGGVYRLTGAVQAGLTASGRVSVQWRVDGVLQGHSALSTNRAFTYTTTRSVAEAVVRPETDALAELAFVNNFAVNKIYGGSYAIIQQIGLPLEQLLGRPS